MRRVAWTAAVVWGVASSLWSCAPDATRSNTSAAGCHAVDAGLDCSAMCRDYCNKLKDCSVHASPTCEDDCRTVTEAGASTGSYQCVIDKACSDISNCGI